MFGLYIFIGFIFNNSYSVVAPNIYTIAGSRRSDTSCFTTSPQRTMAWSHCGGTSCFTPSSRRTSVSKRTLGAYHNILSPPLVLLKQQHYAGSTLQGHMSLLLKDININLISYLKFIKEYHITLSILFFSLWYQITRKNLLEISILPYIKFSCIKQVSCILLKWHPATFEEFTVHICTMFESQLLQVSEVDFIHCGT